MNSVATLELMEIRSDGEVIPLRAEVGHPSYDERGSWACPVLLTSIDEKVREIHGEDSMQALSLAVRFIHSMLRSLLKRGSRLVDAQDSSDPAAGPDFPLDAYFGDNGQQGDGPNEDSAAAPSS